MTYLTRLAPTSLAAATCWFGSLCGFADEVPAPAERVPWQLILQWDNDVLLGTDKDYTNGARVAFVRDFTEETLPDNLLRKSLYLLSGANVNAPLRSLRLPNHQELRFAAGTGLTQLMFTPDDPNALSAPEGERPYAGWLGFEFSLHAKGPESVSSVTLSLGTTGKYSFAEEAQEWVHTNISDSAVYQGWHSQIPGEFTANLHFDHKRRMRSLEATQSWPIEFDGYYEWGAALGNFRTDAYLGSLLRMGYNLPATYSTPRVQLGSYGHALFRERSLENGPFSLLTFAGIRGAAVLHDISLDGPLFEEFDSGVNSRTFVAEFIFGLGIHYRSFDLSLSRTIRSEEFSRQKEHQEFDSLMLRLHSSF